MLVLKAAAEAGRVIVSCRLPDGRPARFRLTAPACWHLGDDVRSAAQKLDPAAVRQPTADPPETGATTLDVTRFRVLVDGDAALVAVELVTGASTLRLQPMRPGDALAFADVVRAAGVRAMPRRETQEARPLKGS